MSLKKKETRKVVQHNDWRDYLAANFPGYVTRGFAPHQVEFWDWVWAIVKGQRPLPFVAIWPRGGAKSTSAELAAATVGMRGTRSYIVYVSETQDQADKHVGTIASVLESAGIERAINKYGSSRGWRRNRLRAASGFTVDALGLDTAARGIKVEEKRPDMMVFDDLDGRHDSEETTQKKIETLTQTVLPAGSNDCAVLAVQNLIQNNSIFARLADGTADFLSDRIVSGPHKAIEGLEYEEQNGEYIITSGTAIWEGQDIKACQDFMKTWGPRAFLRECQHDIAEAEHALWTEAIIEQSRIPAVPHLTRIVVGVDPESTSREDSAQTGIVVVGVGPCGCKGGDPEQHVYVLADCTMRGTPDKWGKAAVAAYDTFKADRIIAEANQGGEMVEFVLRAVNPNVPVTLVHASRAKQARAEPVAALYEQRKAHHSKHFEQLEKQLTNWEPMTGQPSPDRLDALVWAVTDLLPGLLGGGMGMQPQPAMPSRWSQGGGYQPRWKRSR